ncbi:MAG: hypothetical protein JXA50_07090 [Deltaproteobacteria bacterium]|nr:hypothetical protein [Deltaproteobacteria bacterium]
MADKKKKDKDMGGLLIPAGLFIGMGFGFIYNNLTAGLFIGLGAGFAAFALSALIFKK